MIAVVLGTRPEIIKMSPIIRECERQTIPYFILHTGQHYSFEMDKAFFEELGLPKPAYNLDVGSGSHAEQTGNILIGAEKALLRENTDVVLVQGDTNTVLGGALAAAKLHMTVGHVEAGLRSYDRRMPEEINRILTDHISDHLFAPTETARQNLLKEGIDDTKIAVTGNTIVDAVMQNLEISRERKDILTAYDLTPKDYILVTSHRAENVDSKEHLKAIITGLNAIQQEFSIPVLFPAHPRTVKSMNTFGLSPGAIRMTGPLGFMEFLQLEANAKLVLTDSGGVQEETCILGVPCVTLRENTERPETLEVGSNILAGTDADRIVGAAREMLSRKNGWGNPFGYADAGKQIINRSISG